LEYRPTHSSILHKMRLYVHISSELSVYSMVINTISLLEDCVLIKATQNDKYSLCWSKRTLRSIAPMCVMFEQTEMAEDIHSPERTTIKTEKLHRSLTISCILNLMKPSSIGTFPW
jgi:hypothetical protein